MTCRLFALPLPESKLMSMSYYMPYSLYWGVDLGVMGGSLRIMENENGNYKDAIFPIWGGGSKNLRAHFSGLCHTDYGIFWSMFGRPL